MSTVTLVHCTPKAEELITDMARVSNPGNQGNYESAPKLLKYLIKHQHWSPFEMASLCVKIETQRDITAQILRHRSFSFQEYSSRYAEMLRAELPALRRQDVKNRQNSIDDLDEGVRNMYTVKMGKLIVESYRLYTGMLETGVAKETARRILPMCSPTTLYMHGTLRSWIHYLQLRTKPDTQLEHRDVAQKCLSLFRQQFPVIAGAAFDLHEGVG